MGQSSSSTLSSSTGAQSGGANVSYEAKNLMGVDVTNQEGEKLGKIRNLAIGNDGKVSYAVLGTGGLAGMNETELAIPWTQLQISSSGSGGGEDAPKVTLNVSKDQLSSEFAAFEDVREGKSATQSSTTNPSSSSMGSGTGTSTGSSSSSMGSRSSGSTGTTGTTGAGTSDNE